MSYRRFILQLPLDLVKQVLEIHYDYIEDPNYIESCSMNLVLSYVEDVIAEWDTQNGYLVDQDKDYAPEEIKDFTNLIQQYVDQFWNDFDTICSNASPMASE